jgi:hypothetical protein
MPRYVRIYCKNRISGRDQLYFLKVFYGLTIIPMFVQWYQNSIWIISRITLQWTNLTSYFTKS